MAAQRLLQKDPTCHRSRAGLEAAKETMQRLIASGNTRPLLEEEVANALAGICRMSCPKSDGLSRDFSEKD